MTTGNIKKHLDHDNNVICDICGKKKKRSECALAYGTGDIPVIMSCLDGCADYRHPLNDPPPIIFDGLPVPDARPDSTEDNKETFIESPFSIYRIGELNPTWYFGGVNIPNNQFNLNGYWLIGQLPGNTQSLLL